MTELSNLITTVMKHMVMMGVICTIEMTNNDNVNLSFKFFYFTYIWN